jgi:hypothetical protein
MRDVNAVVSADLFSLNEALHPELAEPRIPPQHAVGDSDEPLSGRQMLVDDALIASSENLERAKPPCPTRAFLRSVGADRWLRRQGGNGRAETSDPSSEPSDIGTTRRDSAARLGLHGVIGHWWLGAHADPGGVCGADTIQLLVLLHAE